MENNKKSLIFSIIISFLWCAGCSAAALDGGFDAEAFWAPELLDLEGIDSEIIAGEILVFMQTVRSNLAQIATFSEEQVDSMFSNMNVFFASPGLQSIIASNPEIRTEITRAFERMSLLEKQRFLQYIYHARALEILGQRAQTFSGKVSFCMAKSNWIIKSPEEVEAEIKAEREQLAKIDAMLVELHNLHGVDLAKLRAVFDPVRDWLAQYEAHARDVGSQKISGVMGGTVEQMQDNQKASCERVRLLLTLHALNNSFKAGYLSPYLALLKQSGNIQKGVEDCLKKVQPLPTGYIAFERTLRKTVGHKECEEIAKLLLYSGKTQQQLPAVAASANLKATKTTTAAAA